MAQAGIKSLRGFVLILFLLAVAAAAGAAPRGTINLSPSVRTGAATGGPFLVPNESYTASFVLGLRGIVNSDSFVCDDSLNPCYEVDVNLNLPSDYAATHPTDTIRINLTWDPQASDLDMHVYQPPYNTASGQAFRSSRENPPTPEVVEFPAPSGISTYRVYVVPSAPAATSATVTASIITGPPPTGGGTSTVGLGGPTFTNYRPPATLSTYGDSVNEPTIGVNIGNNKAYMLFTLDTLEATFDDFTSPATATWRNLGRGGAPTTADPFLTMDQHRLPDGSVNNRVWIAQLLAASSYMASNDRQESTTWTRSVTGPGEVHGVDNQSIAVGPYPNNQKPSTARSDANYPHAMYYCSHGGVNAFCSRSDDGGLTFNTSKPIFPLAGNCNNHGHVKVGADGTVYVPMNNSCEGAEGVSISIDAGETWHYVKVPGTVRGRWDSSIAIASDGKTIYYGYGEEDDDRAMIIKGTLDKSDPAAPTIRWQEPAIDVGAAAGLVNIVFPTVVAGDPDRAAFIFHGTTTEGDSGNQAAFPAGAEWYLYAATTFDGGKSWQLRNVTPNDPTQRGSICDSGTQCDNDPDDRNLLDFMDADIDGEGRIVIGYADGCVDGCVASLPNSYTARGYLARQSGGQRMYAKYDPAPPANTPASPALRGTRNALGVSLNWSIPDPGKAPITSFVVERNTNALGFRTLATMAGTATKYDDATAIDKASVYEYRVSAANSYGTGAPSNTIAPVVPQQSVCTPPGVTVLGDGTGDTAGVVTLYGMPIGIRNPSTTDLLSLSVSQPYMPGGALSLVFELKTGGGETLPPNASWFAAFTNPAGVVYAVRMVTDATGAARFESYKVAAASSGARRGEFIEGTATRVNGTYSASSGLITIVMPGANAGINGPGTITNFFAMSTLLPADRASSPLDMMPNDGVATGSLDILAVPVCAPNAAPIAHLSASAINGKPMNVAFDASGSYDPDGASSDPQLRDTIVKYVFDFGDGTAPVATTEPRVTHEYPGNGSWRASLMVQDSRGKASEVPAQKQVCQSCLRGK
ncbi:MAG TPA: PKD domain-containing protein [Thermoanaerobaculia bacterium]|nr:PKD domain-containing protein [Thermoanaerobaculia bacterium]